MKLNELRPLPGSFHKSKRLGRGAGSGKGKTAGRGVKGYKARSGAKLNGFEGGQTPIHMRLPKRGFSNARFRTRAAIVNTGRLQKAVDDKKINPAEAVTAAILAGAGLVRRVKTPVRILGQGQITAALNIEASYASASARKMIEAAGGTVVIPEKPIAKEAAKETPEKAPKKAVEKEAAKKPAAKKASPAKTEK